MNDVDKYQIWIDQNIGINRGYGECHEKCLEMQLSFPELQLRKGFFNSAHWGPRTHWWLRTASGEIVDPTVGQFQEFALTFPAKDSESYEDMSDCPDEELADRVPSGVCMDCGADVYCKNTFCSDACKRATLQYLNGS